MKKVTWLFLMMTLTLKVQAGVTEPIGVWEFNAPDPSMPTVGTPLELIGSVENVTGTNATDGAVLIGEGSYYVCTHGIAPNGGGTKVNQWTLLIDFSYPASSLADPPNGYNDLFQTDPTNADDSDWTINSSGGIGIGAVGYSSAHDFTTQSDTWYRMVVTVENGVRQALYIDGVEIFKGSRQGIDSRFSLSDTLLLFAAGNHQDGDDAPINVSTVAIWDTALASNEVLTLGGAGESVFKDSLAPFVDAGVNQTVELDDTTTAVVTLEGVIMDDNENLMIHWQKVTGPGEVVIEPADSALATSTFSAPGQYSLELSVDDGDFLSSDQVIVSVWAHHYEGLITYWDFEEPWNGQTVMDVSGNLNDGMIVDGWDGISEYTSGKIGQALNLLSDELTESGDWVSLDLTLPDSGTIAMWVNPIDFYNYHSIFDNSGNGGDWEMWIYADSRARFRVEADTAVTANLDSLAEDGDGQNKWWHFAVTWTRDDTQVTTRLYVNGNLMEEATGTWVDPGDTFFVGGGHPDNMVCNSTFDEVKIYDRALPSEEVLGLVYPDNKPPTTHAGDDQTVWLTESGSASILLNGTVEDVDGSPVGKMTQSWQKISGPDGVTIDTPSAQQTIVVFTEPGVYTFSFNASDGQLTGNDEVVTEVFDFGHTGLVVHLPLDGHVNDVAGNHFTTLIDGTEGHHEFVSGVSGQALELSGTDGSTDNDVVSIDYMYTDNGSISLWFKPTVLYNYNSVIDNSGDGNDWEMWVYGSGEFAGRIQSGYVRGFWMEAQSWYHIVMTWHRNPVTPTLVDQWLYVNGELITTNQSEWVTPGDMVFLGGGHTGNEDSNGVIDDFRIYDRTITPAEAQQLASQGQ